MMEDIFLPQLFEGLEQLPQNKQHPSLFQPALFVKHFLKRTSVALLIDIIEVVRRSENLMTFDNIRMSLHRHRPTRNSIEGGLIEITFQLCYWYHFNNVLLFMGEFNGLVYDARFALLCFSEVIDIHCFS